MARRKPRLVTRLGGGNWLVDVNGKQIKRKVTRKVVKGQPAAFVTINGRNVRVQT